MSWKNPVTTLGRKRARRNLMNINTDCYKIIIQFCVQNEANKDFKMSWKRTWKIDRKTRPLATHGWRGGYHFGACSLVPAYTIYELHMQYIQANSLHIIYKIHKLYNNCNTHIGTVCARYKNNIYIWYDMIWMLLRWRPCLCFLAGKWRHAESRFERPCPPQLRSSQRWTSGPTRRGAA